MDTSTIIFLNSLSFGELEQVVQEGQRLLSKKREKSSITILKEWIQEYTDEEPRGTRSFEFKYIRKGNKLFGTLSIKCTIKNSTTKKSYSRIFRETIVTRKDIKNNIQYLKERICTKAIVDEHTIPSLWTYNIKQRN